MGLSTGGQFSTILFPEGPEKCVSANFERQSFFFAPTAWKHDSSVDAMPKSSGKCKIRPQNYLKNAVNSQVQRLGFQGPLAWTKVEWPPSLFLPRFSKGILHQRGARRGWDRSGPGQEQKDQDFPGGRSTGGQFSTILFPEGPEKCIFANFERQSFFLHRQLQNMIVWWVLCQKEAKNDLEITFLRHC